MESRFGPLGGGKQELMIAGVEYDLETMLYRMDLNFEDSWGIDAVAVSEQHFVVRYYDGVDQRVVAHEFDASFNFLGETRAHIAQWIGDDAYYNWFRRMPFRCPLVPGDDF